MGYFFESVKRFKESWASRPVKQHVANISLYESINGPDVVYPINQILELPTDNTGIVCIASEVPELPTNYRMLSKDGPAEATYEDSASPNNRWLGRKLLDVAIYTVALRSVSAQASEDELENLYQDMKAAFPHEICFKALCSGGEVEPKAPNYPHLLESLLARTYLNGLDYTRGFVSILEQNVQDPRRYQNQKYRMQQMQQMGPTPCTDQPIQEQRKSDSASDLVVTEERSTFGSNQFTESIAETSTSEIPRPEVISRVTQQPRVHAEELELPGYTIMLQEYSIRKSVKISYLYTQMQLIPTTKFVCTATSQGIDAAGRECTSKKQAKHEASKALWEKITARRCI